MIKATFEDNSIGNPGKGEYCMDGEKIHILKGLKLTEVRKTRMSMDMDQSEKSAI